MVHPAKQWHFETLGRRAVEALKANRFDTLQEALDRVTNAASPPNARRLNCDTPCAVTGVCSDCRSAQRICNATVILHRKTNGIDMTVVVVGEELGF